MRARIWVQAGPVTIRREGSCGRLSQINQSYLLVFGSTCLICGEGIVQGLQCILTKRNDEIDGSVRHGGPQRNERLCDAGLNVADIGVVQVIIRTIVDQDQRRFLVSAAVSAEVIVRIEKTVIGAPIDFIPAAMAVVTPST